MKKICFVLSIDGDVFLQIRISWGSSDFYNFEDSENQTEG